MQEAVALLRALSLPEIAVNSLTKFRLLSLKTALNQQRECSKCKGKVLDCTKFSVRYDGTQLIFEHEPCRASEEFTRNENARHIIRRALVPPIFSKIRAIDFIKDGRGERNSPAMRATEEAVFEDRSLFIYGEPGTGKTLLASIIAVERAYEGKATLFANVPDVLDDLRDFNQKITDVDSLTPQEKLRRLYRTKCLILDDLGAEKPSDWTCETLFKIINRRYNDGAQLIITSNLSIDALQSRMNFIAGDRIIRRICDMCKPVQVI